MGMNLRRFCSCGRNSAYLSGWRFSSSGESALYRNSRRSEWVAHVARLKAAGWRKAQAI